MSNAPVRALLERDGWQVSGTLTGLDDDDPEVVWYRDVPHATGAGAATLYHLALRRDWEAAVAVGRYEVSTLGRTLAEQGFVHTSLAGQVAAVGHAYYRGVTEPLVLLVIDRDRLSSPVLVEPVPGTGERCPAAGQARNRPPWSAGPSDFRDSPPPRSGCLGHQGPAEFRDSL